MEPWQVLSSTELLNSPPWLRVSAEHVRLPNGVEIADFYRIEMPEWAQIFAVTVDDQVAMIEQYKHGPGLFSLELPAGYLEPGEAPEASARRELREETGLEADEWRYLGRYFIDGNRGCGTTHIFLARGARRAGAPQLEAAELITQRQLSLADVRAALRDGQIRSVATVAAVGLALAVLGG